jgi:hypothetical protein
MIKINVMRDKRPSSIRRNKYGNEQVVIDGHRFASHKEAARFAELCLLRRAGQISGLEVQPRFPITVNGVHICYYVADFSYRLPNGLSVVEDAKGFKTPEYKLKRRLMLAVHNVEVVEV